MNVDRLEYEFIRSNRTTIGITVKPDGRVILRAPMRCSQKRAEEFLEEKRDWIERAQKRMAERRAREEAESGGAREGAADDRIDRVTGLFYKEYVDKLKRIAKKRLSVMVAETAAQIGVSYGTITVRAQKTRWGSCSAKGNLNFNCLLVLLPENIQRYVVVHELCHRREMNHSQAFWREVAKYCPTYREDRKQLREMGSELMEKI